MLTTPGARNRMNRLMLPGVALVAAGVVLTFVTGGRGGVRGSGHDFAAAGYGGDACSACHLPHADAGPKTGKWEKKPRDGVTPYRGLGGVPGPLSMRCLSCHDGTTATSTFADETSGLAVPPRERASRLGDLQRNHPVGVTYPYRGRSFQPVSSVTASARVRLFGGKVECASCHDPHNRYNLRALLVMPNGRSELCYTCHRL